jgi:Uma2 family endonuclease
LYGIVLTNPSFIDSPTATTLLGFFWLIFDRMQDSLSHSKGFFSVREYLEMEDAATDKHEYYLGEIFAMSGKKMSHNKIAKNLLVNLELLLKGKPCEPFGSDLRIHIEKNTLFTYPDISIFCEEPASLAGDDMNFLNPAVIIEVLSASSSKYDRVDKFRLYRDIPSLREYILIDSKMARIEAFHINESGFWELREYKNLTEQMHIVTVSESISLADIYAGVQLLDYTGR